MNWLPPRFLNWRLMDGRKVPCTPNGMPCDAHDPANHTDYATASAAPFGVAFDVRAEDGLYFLDLDKCRTEAGWSAEATAIFTSFSGAWGEVSQSGTGLHIMGRCDPSMLKDRRNKFNGWCEFYTDGRFVAFGPSGWQPIGGTATDQDWTGQLLKLVPQREFLGELPDGVDPAYTGPADDAALIDMMLRATGGAGAAFGMKATVADLWAADAAVLRRVWPQGDGYDASSADAALMTHLAFWTGKDMPRMDRLFRMSGLMRDKYRDRPDYRSATVQTAARLCKKVYDHVAPVREVAALPAPEVYLTIAEQLKHFDGCVYIRSIHRVMVPGGELLRPDQFNADRGGYIFQMEPGGTGPTKKAFEAFTENRGYKYPKAKNMMFDPKLPGGMIVGDAVNTYFDPCVKRVAGDVSRFLDLLAKLLPDPGDRAILLNYMAALVQNPGVKFQWAPVLQGCEGNGKTALASCLAYAVGEPYAYGPRADQVGGQFNGWIAQKLLIIIEEVHMRDRREVLDALKPLITNLKVEAEKKGVDQVMVENRANFFMCTNHKDAVIKTLGDRRYSIFFTAQQRPGDLARDGMGGAYFPSFYRWLQSEGGYAAVAHYLMHYAVDPAFNPAGDCHRAPQTSSTAEAMRRTSGTIEMDVLEATEDGTQGFKGGWISAHAVDKLLVAKRHTISRNRQAEIIESLGYIQWGRAPRIIQQEDQKRPMIYRLPTVQGEFEDFMKAQGYFSV